MELKRAELKANYELKLWIAVELVRTSLYLLSTLFSRCPSPSRSPSWLIVLFDGTATTQHSRKTPIDSSSPSSDWVAIVLRCTRPHLIPPIVWIWGLPNWLWITSPTTVAVSSASLHTKSPFLFSVLFSNFSFSLGLGFLFLSFFAIVVQSLRFQFLCWGNYSFQLEASIIVKICRERSASIRFVKILFLQGLILFFLYIWFIFLFIYW